MTFEFESQSEQDLIKLDYYIFIPNVQTLKKLYSNINADFYEKEFDNYFTSNLKNNYKSQNAYEPIIFEVLEKFYILKGIMK